MYSDDDLRREYKYYFTAQNAHPWSYKGIMYDIQHALYNGYGLTEGQINDMNLIARINKLSDDYEKMMAESELQKAKALADRRSEKRNQEWQEREETEKLDAMNSYKKTWRQTSFFYKITHKKQNPKNINFDNFDSEEIKEKESHLRK